MSIFGSIVSAIFGSPANAAEITPAGTATGAPAAGAPTPMTASPPAAAATPAAAAASAKVAAVDVAAVLDRLDEESDKGDLDWRKSIVDLMKLLDLDSSLSARKALADELKYTGDKSDSAKMNVWLHKQVMTKLAENGGKVPNDLKH